MRRPLGLIGADFLLVCDQGFSVFRQYGVLFETHSKKCKIVKVALFADLVEEHREWLCFCKYYENCAITPALANLHTHLEFSANRGLLTFGDFGQWLDSVILHREVLMQEGLQVAMQDTLKAFYRSGVGTMGAISSYGLDLEVLSESGLQVVFFNEVIGANPQMADALYQNFLARFEASSQVANSRFIPAVAIHSPYSVGLDLLQKTLNFAREKSLLVSTHFLESSPENQWLRMQNGYFAHFFKKFLHADMKPFYTPLSFLQEFWGLNVFLAHCLFANEAELAQIAKMNAHIISAPRSNRLLCKRYLDLELVTKMGLFPLFATDGLSSNESISLLDELRLALYAYPLRDLESFARELLLATTLHAQRAIGVKAGVLQPGFLADMAIFPLLKTTPTHQLANTLLLYAKEARGLVLNGRMILD